MNVFPFGDYNKAATHAARVGGTVLFDEWTLNHALLTDRGRLYWVTLHTYGLSPTVSPYIVVS